MILYRWRSSLSEQKPSHRTFPPTLLRDDKGTGAGKATGCRRPKKAAALPRIINSSRSNVFMHVQSDLFHPQPKARWQHSLAESPLSSTGSLRASQAKWGRRRKDQSGSHTAGVNISLAALAFNTDTNAQMLQFTISIWTRLQLHLLFRFGQQTALIAIASSSSCSRNSSNETHLSSQGMGSSS